MAMRVMGEGPRNLLPQAQIQSPLEHGAVKLSVLQSPACGVFMLVPRGFPAASLVKNPPAMQETWI